MIIYFILFLFFTGITFAGTNSSESTGVFSSPYKISKDEYIAQSHFMGGLTLSLVEANSSDLELFFGDIYQLDAYVFSFTGFTGCFFRDGLAAGIKAGFEQSKGEFDFLLLKDILDISQRKKYLSRGYSVEPYFRNYLKLFDTKNLYFFNETALMLQYSSGILQTDDHTTMNKTLLNAWKFEFGIRPGVNIFIFNRLAFETSISLLGLSSSFSTIHENDQKKSHFNYNIINFKVNLLALDFSLVYFL